LAAFVGRGVAFVFFKRRVRYYVIVVPDQEPPASENISKPTETRLRRPRPSHVAKAHAPNLPNHYAKIGNLEFSPARIKEFHRDLYDGVVLDDVRDLKFLVAQQHAPREVEEIADVQS